MPTSLRRACPRYRPESVAITAGRIMLARLRELAEGRADSAFETTLAARDRARWLLTLRESGYRAHLVFLSLPSPEASVARVAERVRMGGHQFPNRYSPPLRRRPAQLLRPLPGRPRIPGSCTTTRKFATHG